MEIPSVRGEKQIRGLLDFKSWFRIDLKGGIIKCKDLR